MPPMCSRLQHMNHRRERARDWRHLPAMALSTHSISGMKMTTELSSSGCTNSALFAFVMPSTLRANLRSLPSRPPARVRGPGSRVLHHCHLQTKAYAKVRLLALASVVGSKDHSCKSSAELSCTVQGTYARATHLQFPCRQTRQARARHQPRVPSATTARTGAQVSTPADYSGMRARCIATLAILPSVPGTKELASTQSSSRSRPAAHAQHRAHSRITCARVQVSSVRTGNRRVLQRLEHREVRIRLPSVPAPPAFPALQLHTLSDLTFRRARS